MEVYIQGEKSLIPIQEEVTAESIEEALGYTPADAEDIIECIEESDDSALYVTDKDGNIITKTDGDGFHAAEVYIRDENGEKTVSEMISEAVADLDVDVDFTECDPTVPDWAKQPTKPTYTAEEVGAVDNQTFETHESDTDKHLGGDISTENGEALYICDKDGNIIARFDGDGLDVTDLKVNSQPIDEYLSDIVENSGEACDHEYVTIQELIRNTTDCTTWKDLQYCSSCGKVHANLLHTEHTYGEWKVSIPVECEVDGMEERTCIRCDDAETQTIPALGHNMVTVAAQEPTYSSVGWNEHQKCSRCGHTEGYEEIPMLTIYPLTITISQTAYTDPGSGMTTVGNVAGINGIVASQIDASETLVYKVDATYTKNGYLKLSSRSTNCTCTLVCDDETRGIYTLTISNPTGAVTVEIR